MPLKKIIKNGGDSMSDSRIIIQVKDGQVTGVLSENQSVEYIIATHDTDLHLDEKLIQIDNEDVALISGNSHEDPEEVEEIFDIFNEYN